MINPQELKIGNIVKCRIDNQTVIENRIVCSITEEKIGTLDGGTHKPEDLLPIQITGSILRSAGFCKYDKLREHYIIYSLPNINIQHRCANIWMISLIDTLADQITFSYTTYLHQLQNVYFTITGQELKLKLGKYE